MSESQPNDAEVRDLEYHGRNHGERGRDKVIHRLLGFLHSDASQADPVRGDIITAQGATPKWSRLARSVPGAAGLLNVLGFKNGDTEPTWYAAEHNLLDGARHPDTAAGTATRGDVITAQGASPLWTRLARSVPAANVRNVFGLDNGDTEPAWKTALDATNPTTIAEGAAGAPGTSLVFSHRDHEHPAPATWKATAHNLLDGDRHGDTVAQAVSRGSLVYGNSTPKWDELAIGGANQVLRADGTDVSWGAIDQNYIANRTRRVSFDLGAFVQTAGTGARANSAGLWITFPDAETGTWRAQKELPADWVTGTCTAYWLWETPSTAANCMWAVSVGVNGANGSHAGTNIRNDAGALYASNGTGSLLTLSSVSIASITAGQSDLSIQFSRVGGDATDTLSAEARLRAFWLEYTADS